MLDQILIIFCDGPNISCGNHLSCFFTDKMVIHLDLLGSLMTNSRQYEKLLDYRTTVFSRFYVFQANISQQNVISIELYM